MNDDIISKVYVDIVNGYSKTIINKNTVYIKHFNIFSQIEIDEIRAEKLNLGLSKGLSTEKEKMASLKKKGIWTKQDDEDYISIKFELEGAKNTRKNMFLPSQIHDFDNLIKENEEKLRAKNHYKGELLGLTAEKYADKAASNFYICKSLFTDEKLQNSYLTTEYFNDIDDDELSEIINAYNEGIKYLEHDNIKKTALSTNFQTFYSLSNNNPYYLFGKFICSLTYYQTSLLSYAKYYSSILSELGNLINDKIKDDPDKLERFYLSTQNQNKTQGNKEATEYFGGKEGDFVPTARDFKEAEMLQKGFNSIDALNNHI